MQDPIEKNLPEAQRRVYREEKELNQLFRQACSEEPDEAREAQLQLRRRFYEAKRGIEALQEKSDAAKEGGDAKRFWAGEGGAEMGRLTNVCRNIVALFNDLDLALHERVGADVKQPVERLPGNTSYRAPNKRLPRTYQGL